MSERGTFRPLNGVSVQQGGEDRQCWVSIPKAQREELRINKGDTLVPVTQDGLLVFVPVGKERTDQPEAGQ